MRAKPSPWKHRAGKPLLPKNKNPAEQCSTGLDGLVEAYGLLLVKAVFRRNSRAAKGGIYLRHLTANAHARLEEGEHFKANRFPTAGHVQRICGHTASIHGIPGARAIVYDVVAHGLTHHVENNANVLVPREGVRAPFNVYKLQGVVGTNQRILSGEGDGLTCKVEAAIHGYIVEVPSSSQLFFQGRFFGTGHQQGANGNEGKEFFSWV